MTEISGDKERVICPVCGSIQASEARFCAQCGASLAGADRQLILPNEEFPETRDLSGRILAEKYRLLAAVGQGGMGTVYKAEHTVLGRVVAVKVLHPEMVYDASAVARFKAEARAASRLNHPNIISVTDFGQTPDGLFFLVTEFLHGFPLSQLLSNGKPVDVALSYYIIRQALEGIQQAHDLGIVHRDLKPENIFLERFRDGSVAVKVLDFGVAKDLEATGPALTSPGMVCGTPEYMSPEQAMGKQVDPRTDVYALGIVLYEMVAGTNPFERSSPAESMIAHVRDEAPRLSSLVSSLPSPKLLDAVVAMAIAKDPAQRYQDARSFLSELQAWAKAAKLDFADQEEPVRFVWPQWLEERFQQKEEHPRRSATEERNAAQAAAASGTEALLALLEGESPNRIHIEDSPSPGVPASLSSEAEQPAPILEPPREPTGDLFGRDQVLAELLDAVTVAGRAMVTAELGMGKTALLKELVTRWKGRGWPTWTIEARGHINSSAPLEPFSILLGQIRKTEKDFWCSLGSMDRRILDTLIDTGLPTEGSLTGVALRELESSWIVLLGKLRETALVVFDDLDRFDSASQHLMTASQEAVAKGLVSCSVVTASRHPSDHTDLPHVTLAPLRPDDVRGLGFRLATRLGASTAQAASIVVPEAAAGNPFFIEHAIRAELEGSLPERGVTTPMDILDARLSRLPNSARWALQVTCLIDEPATEEDIASVLGELVREWELADNPEKLFGCLADLERKGLLIATDNRWQAAHAMVSEAVANLTPAEFRRRTHEIFVRRRLSRLASPPSAETFRLALHAMAAETDDDDALELCQQAGSYSFICGASVESGRQLGFVVDRLRRRWAQGGIGDKDLVSRLGTTARMLALALRKAGQGAAAQGICGEASVLARSEGLDAVAAGLLLDMAEMDLSAGQFESGVSELADALDLVAGRHWYLDTLVSMRLGELLARRGRFESALDRYADAAVAAGTNQGRGNPFLWQVPLELSQLHEGWGKRDQALDFARQALLNAEEQSDVVGRLKCHQQLGRLEAAFLRWDKARFHAETVEETALEIPDRRRAAAAAFDAAQALSRLGDKRLAREKASRARKLATESGDENLSVRIAAFLVRLEHSEKS